MYMFNEASSSLSNPFVWIMIGVIVFLLIVIKALAGVLLNAARGAREAENGGMVKSGLAVVAGPIVNGLSDTAFYFMISVIGVEILVILYLVYNINKLLKREAAAAAVSEDVERIRPVFSFGKWWTKVNRFRPAEEEAGMDMGHDYDGIRELDNKLPPWWLYGFYCTMIFGVIYLWRYHVAHTAPLPAEEYRIAVQEAAIQKEVFLKKAANSVDENTVKLLTGAADLEAGKAVFETTCFACHGKSGEGGVGPNLTDAYWLHGGSIEEVFKTIKYGWPDKGMKSWKDDFSPVQIARIASYVKSLEGTNPPNAKPPQGVLVK
jgi:cytochrome c oxidase cbb3-type subunit 3